MDLLMLLRVFLIMMLPLISYGQTEADEKKENRIPPAVTEEVTPPESESVYVVRRNDQGTGWVE